MGAKMAASDAYIEASGAAPVIGEILQHAKGEARLVRGGAAPRSRCR